MPRTRRQVFGPTRAASIGEPPGQPLGGEPALRADEEDPVAPPVSSPRISAYTKASGVVDGHREHLRARHCELGWSDRRGYDAQGRHDAIHLLRVGVTMASVRLTRGARSGSRLISLQKQALAASQAVHRRHGNAEQRGEEVAAADGLMA